MIGLLGATGAVGAAAAAHLGAWTTSPVRLGARRPKPGMVAVDVDDPVALAAFCRGCAVVLNCAGPASRIGIRVAEAAFDAGADYVDAAGDDDLAAQLAGVAPDRVAVVSAGLMPGLTALLPRLLATTDPVPPRHLSGYVGGRDRFTPAAAEDYLHSGFGRAGVALVGGAVVDRAVRTDVELPFCAEPGTAVPYLSTELRRVAERLGVTDVQWDSLFTGPHLRAALRRPLSAAALVRAADLDTFGHEPYQLIVVEFDAARTALLRGRGASELTGAFAALTASAVARGEVPAGVHHAGEVLDPVASARRLGDAPAVTELTVLDAGAYASGGYLEETL